MKILILGNGYLAHHFHAFFRKISKLSFARINDFRDIDAELYVEHPDIVINCIGKTGKPNIDWCETHKEETNLSNLIVPLLIQRACTQRNIRMIHISTGCVYDGYDKHFTETDPSNYQDSYYSRTKYLCEQALKEFNVLQLRIRMPIDSVPHPRNLLNKLLSYKEIISIENSITVVPDLMQAAKHLIETKETGIFNVVNTGSVTHWEILNIYNAYSPLKKEIATISMNALRKKIATSRSNCVLSNQKLRDAGFLMPNTIVSLNRQIKKYVSYNARVLNAAPGR